MIWLDLWPNANFPHLCEVEWLSYAILFKHSYLASESLLFRSKCFRWFVFVVESEWWREIASRRDLVLLTTRTPSMLHMGCCWTSGDDEHFMQQRAAWMNRYGPMNNWDVLMTWVCVVIRRRSSSSGVRSTWVTGINQQQVEESKVVSTRD